MTKANITHVVQGNLCASCGACFAVCKPGAIEFEETTGGNCFPVVDDESCINCGLCSSVCPGDHFSDELKNKIPEDPFSGQYMHSFVGKAKNKKIYENSQSGGIVSALAIHAMESGLADTTVTVVMDWGKPPRPKASFARCADEIVLSQKSKYCPVPTLSILKDVIDSDQRIIFVGTPCQVHGLYNIMDKIPKLKDNNIALIIGLVCDRVMTYAALDYLVRKGKLGNKANQLLAFRDKACGGYPGKVHIQSMDGQNKIMSASARMQIKDYFTPARCRICFDKMNIFADITVGDPHELEGIDREHGESMFVVRTMAGLELVQSAKRVGAVAVRPVLYKQVTNGQHIDEKRIQWSSYARIWKQTGRSLPDYYELIKKSAPSPSMDRQYRQNLNYALGLDNADSRNILIKDVQNALTRKKRLRRFLFPWRFLKRVVRKILSTLG